MITPQLTLVCEFLAHWIGGVSHPELGRLLGYTPRRLADLIEDGFKRLGKRTVTYDSTFKLHRTVVPTKDLHGLKRVSDVVTTLQAARLWNGPSELICPIADTRAYRPEPAPDVFRTLLAACTRRQVVEVTYLAKTRQHTVLFSPHTLVTSTHRVHFRGFSVFERDAHWSWWDLVPSRVTRAELLRSSGYVGDAEDIEWHAIVCLEFQMRATLSEPMRDAIRREHSLNSDRLRIKDVRRALAHYVAADYTDRRYQGFDGPAWELISGDV